MGFKFNSSELLLLLILAVRCLLSARSCDIECERLHLIPPRYTYRGSLVPMVALKCSVKGDCHLDFYEFLSKQTSKESFSSSAYINVDIYFSCLCPGSKLDFNEGNTTDKSICISLRLEDCNTTWRDVAQLGRQHYLMETEMIFANRSAASAVAHLNAPAPGLSHLICISFIFLNFNETHIDIVDLLPYRHVVMPVIGMLFAQCTSSSKLPDSYCEENSVSYSLSQLAELFPHLQMLSLSGIHPRERSEELVFPWSNSPLPLPLNFSHANVDDRFKFDEYRNENNSNVIRSLLVTGQYIPDLTYICPFQRNLAAITITRGSVNSLPVNCFTSNTNSNLQFLDLSRNNLGRLPDGVFKGFTSLGILHLAMANLSALQLGLFDDMVNLRVLDLDYNNIKSLSKGLFSSLVSLKYLFFHQNLLQSIEYQTLPIYSPNLTFVDLRWNKLQEFPYDCLTLPNLERCDLDHNQISISNMAEIMWHFDPVKMYLVQPLAYYGETKHATELGGMHESDQAQISLRDNGVNRIDFNLTWPIEWKRQLAALLSFYQFNLESSDAQSTLSCDCCLYDLKKLINTFEARDLLVESTYAHSLLLSATNFQSWKCRVNPVLKSDTLTKEFLRMPDTNFICKNRVVFCPPGCTCYNYAADLAKNKDSSVIVDCSNNTSPLRIFPKYVPLPADGSGMVVSLEYNIIESLADCETPGYEWLKHVTKLNLQNNKLSPKDSNELDYFLSCLKRVTHLYLTNNNIKYLPISMASKKYKELSIDGNSLVCDCTTLWMKQWLQDNNNSIQQTFLIQCNKEHPIVQVKDSDFWCDGILQYVGVIATMGSIFLLTVIVSIACYNYKFELKIWLFEKLNWHPFDKQSEEEGKCYDVYLMYCSQDQVWVINTLLPGLEQCGYKTCVSDRDFTLGASTAAEMSEAFSKTHRVIVVLSQSFINNVGAMSDFYHAYEHDRSPMRRRFLIMIQLHSSINFGDHQIFKKYISTNYFIPVRAKDFWYRLRYWLPAMASPSPPAATDNIDTDPNEDLLFLTDRESHQIPLAEA